MAGDATTRSAATTASSAPREDLVDMRTTVGATRLGSPYDFGLATMPSARCRYARPSDDDDVEHSRSVDPLDPLELDVGRGRRAGHQCDRAAGIERRQRLGHRGDDLARAHEADVAVRHERERAPAACR